MSEQTSYLLLCIILLTVIIIIVVCLIVTKRALIQSSYHFMEGIRYLNVNSTLAPRTGYYNPSDLGYTNMRILRNEKERTFNEIKKFVNAPENSKVILTSGATEAIATCINWARKYNRYGAIYGTPFDHSAIKENAENQEMKYAQISDANKITNASAIFLTHVNSRNGEIMDDGMMTIANRIRSSASINPEFNASDIIVLPYEPLVFIDATQSITKIPIDMSATGANALFFSLHKIGGPMNEGILIVNEPKDKPFVPLIAGAQNDGMRGGTLNEAAFVENRDIFEYEPAPETRAETWNKAVKKLEDKGINVSKPKGEHLFNTIVIRTDECPLAAIDSLYKKGICVGTLSACENERMLTGGAEVDKTIRISFMNSDELDEKTIDTIIATIKNN